MNLKRANHHSYHRPNLSNAIKAQLRKSNLPKIASIHPKESFRVWYLPRVKMRENPAVVIRFEGVLGDYIKQSLWTSKAERHIAANSFAGLSRLRKNFQVVLTCCLNSKQIKDLIGILEENGAMPDAIYVKLDSAPFSYSQIISDFTPSRFIVLPTSP